ncbi:uncharacterized protein N7479_011492 [Penicillium vulpinum]|uniref:uncharacterized protein n=1 Tax=Penicillium vulpinum TaxID=29845 RepID=UPI0025469ADC|nr:uncharacterized protein N7479_011492 [Penicillium vulpinum]KAJ5953079.1 hypothetical protein N7479_011492 [Penicillium vulpinum]
MHRKRTSCSHPPTPYHNCTGRIDGLAMGLFDSSTMALGISNKRPAHAGLLLQEQNHTVAGANILADIKAISEKSWEARKKARP